MIEINDSTFNNKVIEKNEEDSIPFILFFYSENCKYCHQIENFLNLLEKNKNYKNSIHIYKIKTNTNKILVDRYNVRGTPLVYLFNGDKNLETKIIGGNIDYVDFYSYLDKIVNYTEESFFNRVLRIIK